MSKSPVAVSIWAVLSAVVSGSITLATILLYRDSLFAWAGSQPYQPGNPVAQGAVPVRGQPPTATPAIASQPAQAAPASPELGPRHKLTYQQWMGLLAQEARVAAEQRPANLAVLAGDSLSLWFPPELLPDDRPWLNQAISGETSDQLLRRLDLFDATRPATIFVMIGINDLRQGYSDATVLANHRAIVRHLKAAHPQAQILVQAILPHAGDCSRRSQPGARPEWADQLAAVPNRRIRSLNQQLAAIARSETVRFLDLYPHFADAEGNLLATLSTDGLHLSRRGYEVWRTQIDRARAKSR